MPNLEVKELVQEVLDCLPDNIKDSEDVVYNVFFVIEINPAWRQRYDVLETNLGQHELNKGIAWWVAKILGKRGYERAPAPKSNLIQTEYSKIKMKS